jgi:hypothetical protein
MKTREECETTVGPNKCFSACHQGRRPTVGWAEGIQRVMPEGQELKNGGWTEKNGNRNPQRVTHVELPVHT